MWVNKVICTQCKRKNEPVDRYSNNDAQLCSNKNLNSIKACDFGNGKSHRIVSVFGKVMTTIIRFVRICK